MWELGPLKQMTPLDAEPHQNLFEIRNIKELNMLLDPQHKLNPLSSLIIGQGELKMENLNFFQI